MALAKGRSLNVQKIWTKKTHPDDDVPDGMRHTLTRDEILAVYDGDGNKNVKLTAKLTGYSTVWVHRMVAQRKALENPSDLKTSYGPNIRLVYVPTASFKNSSKTEINKVHKLWMGGYRKNRLRGEWRGVEIPGSPGFPDLIGHDGVCVAFVECKYFLRLPEDKPTDMGLTKDQRLFLMCWPNAWLFFRVRDDIYLMPGSFVNRKPKLPSWWRENSIHTQRLKNVNSIPDALFYHMVFGTVDEYIKDNDFNRVEDQRAARLCNARLLVEGMSANL